MIEEDHPSSSSIDIHGSDDMQDLYFRNNRNDGLKNLQCFPHCTHKHMEKQFCGSSLTCSVRLCGELAGIPPENLLVVGQFRTQEDFCSELPQPHGATRAGGGGGGEEDDIPELELDLDLPYQHFLRERKTISSMFGCFYEGTRVSVAPPALNQNQNQPPEQQQQQYQYQFNAELAGWNYGWQSNKHKTKDWHVFQVSVYVLTATAGSSGPAGDQQEQQQEQDKETGTATLPVPVSVPVSVSPQESLSLLLRTSTPPFRILSARRKKDFSSSCKQVPDSCPPCACCAHCPASHAYPSSFSSCSLSPCSTRCIPPHPAQLSGGVGGGLDGGRGASGAGTCSSSTKKQKKLKKKQVQKKQGLRGGKARDRYDSDDSSSSYSHDDSSCCYGEGSGDGDVSAGEEEENLGDRGADGMISSFRDQYYAYFARHHRGHYYYAGAEAGAGAGGRGRSVSEPASKKHRHLASSGSSSSSSGGSTPHPGYNGGSGGSGGGGYGYQDEDFFGHSARLPPMSPHSLLLAQTQAQGARGRVQGYEKTCNRLPRLDVQYPEKLALDFSSSSTATFSSTPPPASRGDGRGHGYDGHERDGDAEGGATTTSESNDSTPYDSQRTPRTTSSTSTGTCRSTDGSSSSNGVSGESAVVAAARRRVMRYFEALNVRSPPSSFSAEGAPVDLFRGGSSGAAAAGGWQQQKYRPLQQQPASSCFSSPLLSSAPSLRSGDISFPRQQQQQQQQQPCRPHPYRAAPSSALASSLSSS